MYIGELAALGTAVFWAFSSLFFTFGGRRVGAEVVNLNRLIFGLLFVVIVQVAMSGSLYPTGIESWRHGLLFLSAFIGLVIGDGALFFAFVLIGPRLSMLIMILVPVFTALFARICFDETLTWPEWLAVLFTIAAIAYVIQADRTDRAHSVGVIEGKGQFLKGVMLAIVGAMGQTGNLIITKFALVDNFSTLAATEIRILYSTIIVAIWMVAKGKSGQVASSFRDTKATAAIAAGALIGPFIGIWLSYIAINNTRVAIASVIMATVPLLLIPLSAYFLKEEISARSVLGTIAAFAGIAVLLLTDFLLQ